ncbi:MAG: cation diffusion facilitator family transporter [Kiritimatiellae bacterium]|jgi:cation diffusion facilitator family transporter|nr:cation diffusion facilitator family transporter [Kiritimatiellia bacterium]MDD4341650.1 cation diffusion facilitator family transporter [Kiritimatiellia bacterium]MDY0149937.1 cation diffusion facilitator family transporter [Kiritimatiellia bacterium]
MTPERRVTHLSIWTNVALAIIKLVAGIVGHSQALIADAMHSLSDFATDIAVLVGLRLSAKPRDDDHAYGHGKYETLVAAIIGLALGAVALKISSLAIQQIFAALRGNPIPAPAIYAFWAALASLVVKEGLYHLTMRVARTSGSSSLVANAWHHRSDALSSLATAGGVGAAALLGREWLILDPIAALFVSLFLVRIAWRILSQQVGELTDRSLEPDVCEEILAMARRIPGLTDPHNLRTRMVGRHPVIDLHIRLPATVSLQEAHDTATTLEQELLKRFGKETIANLHLEPYSE